MLLVSAQAIASAQSSPLPVQPVIPSSQDQLIEVAVALGFVLILIYGLAWLIKRKQAVTGLTNLPMKTLGVLPMGVKEKIVLVEVGGKQILLGMTPTNINALATFDEPIIDSQEQDSPSFSHKLKSILAQQKSKKEVERDLQPKASEDEK